MENAGRTPQAGQIPGMRTTRPANAEAMQKLSMLMFQGMKKLGEEGLKGPNADPVEMARARAMIQQAQVAARGMAPQEPQRPQMPGSPQGRVQRPDRAVDIVTGQAPAGYPGHTP